MEPQVAVPPIQRPHAAWSSYSAAARSGTSSIPDPKSARHGGRHSTIVRCRSATSTSMRTSSRTCSGTRARHHRCTRATSVSGRPDTPDSLPLESPALRRSLESAPSRWGHPTLSRPGRACTSRVSRCRASHRRGPNREARNHSVPDRTLVAAGQRFVAAQGARASSRTPGR